MSDEYETEIERFIIRSLEHLERKGKENLNLIIHTTNNETGERYRTKITIRKIEKNNEENEH